MAAAVVTLRGMRSRALDSTSMVSRDQSARIKRAGSHTFVLRDSMWTDAKSAAAGAKTIRIKAFSKAYFDLIAAVPELRELFAVGDRVTVQGRGVTVIVNGDGKEEMSTADLKLVSGGW